MVVNVLELTLWPSRDALWPRYLLQNPVSAHVLNLDRSTARQKVKIKNAKMRRIVLIGRWKRFQTTSRMVLQLFQSSERETERLNYCKLLINVDWGRISFSGRVFKTWVIFTAHSSHPPAVECPGWFSSISLPSRMFTVEKYRRQLNILHIWASTAEVATEVQNIVLDMDPDRLKAILN